MKLLDSLLSQMGPGDRSFFAGMTIMFIWAWVTCLLIFAAVFITHRWW